MERTEEPANESYRCESIWIALKYFEIGKLGNFEIYWTMVFNCNIMQVLKFQNFPISQFQNAQNPLL